MRSALLLPMDGRWKPEPRWRPRRVHETIEIDAPVGQVFERWSRCEEFPRWMQSVRRTKRIGERGSLWDVDILGHQVVWEAQVVEWLPERRIRWTSRSGAPNAGCVRFEPLPGDRTRLTVSIEYRPRGLVERVGAWLGQVDTHVRRDLERFRRVVEREAQRAAA